MKLEYSSQRREMLLFLTTNMAAVTSRANTMVMQSFFLGGGGGGTRCIMGDVQTPNTTFMNDDFGYWVTRHRTLRNGMPLNSGRKNKNGISFVLF